MVMTTMHKSPIRTTRPDDQIEDQVVHGDGLFTTHIRMWDVSPGSWIKKWWGVSMVSRVTGRNVRDEVSSRSITTNFDLLLHIKKMRLGWLVTRGHPVESLGFKHPPHVCGVHVKPHEDGREYSNGYIFTSLLHVNLVLKFPISNRWP